jgi:acetyl esterase/lipase
MRDGISPSPETAFPFPLIDIGFAMKCINEHADNWLVDTDRIGLCGFSAGAHNCALYSTYWDKPLISEPLGGVTYRPAAAILAYGIYNFSLVMAPARDEFATKMRKTLNAHFLGSTNPDESFVESVSPAHLVTNAHPPVFIWTTREDSLIPVENTCEMALALAKAGVPFECHIYEKGEHGLSLANQATASSQQDINPIVASWTTHVESWLLNRFALSLPQEPLWMKMKD